MVQSINPARIVPVSEDLTLPYNTFEVIRGYEYMKRRDFPLSSGVVAVPGEWLVLGNNGKLTRPTSTPKAACYPVLCGTDRFDVAANGAATVIMNSDVVIRTTSFNKLLSYNVGDYLTVKDLGAGEAYVTKALTGQPGLAMVTAASADALEFQLAPVAVTAP